MGSRRIAESLLFEECGPEVVKALRPHLGALVSVADLAPLNPLIRPFLRYIGEVHNRLTVADATIQRWHTQCGLAEAQLQEARAEIESLRAYVVHERQRADTLDKQLLQARRACDGSDAQRLAAEGRLGSELKECQAQLVQLGSRGMVQSQQLAAKQAEEVAWAHEIQRLRVELEVIGSMGRQSATALEVARRQAANSDITAEQASQERVRLEALLRNATREQHNELVSATQSASAEASRMQARVEQGRNELAGLRSALSGMESMWGEVRSAAPCCAAAAEFLRDPDSPAVRLLQQPRNAVSAGPSVRIPVLALRWRPGAALNTTPAWSAVRSGLYCTFHQLQTGAVQPEELELAVCCAEGRWVCTREEDDASFAALLMYQVLHRDAPVAPSCRIGSVHALTDRPQDLASAAGLSVRSSGALWRTPPLDEEDFFRAFMRDSPLWEVVEEFLYQRRRLRVEGALQAEARRDPIGAVVPVVPGPLRVPPAAAQARPRAVI